MVNVKQSRSSAVKKVNCEKANECVVSKDLIFYSLVVLNALIILKGSCRNDDRAFVTGIEGLLDGKLSVSSVIAVLCYN